MWFKIDNSRIDLTTSTKLVDSITAAEITVKKIMAEYPPPYRLMVSGGVDSQAMIYAWKLFGKDYIPSSIVFNDNLNRHDLSALDLFAKRENIEIEFIDFNIMEFYEGRFFDIAEKYRCVSPQFAAHIGMSENLNGTCIFSGDRLQREQAVLFDTNLPLLYASYDRPIVPYFFMHTPENAYGLMYDHIGITFPLNPYRKKIVSEEQEILSKKFYYDLKISQWTKSGFPVIPQEKKFNGFEKVKEEYEKTHKHLVTKKIKLEFSLKTNYHTESQWAYDYLLRYPYEKKFGVKNYQHIINKL